MPIFWLWAFCQKRFGHRLAGVFRLGALYQDRGFRAPLYRVAGTSGPDHEKAFEVEVVVEGKVLARGKGKNKKEAEQVGAEEALKGVEGKKKG